MTALTYHKSATRDVRPFFSAATLEDALGRAQIRLFDDQPFTDSTTFSVEEQDQQRLALVVRPNVDAGALKSSPISTSKLELVVSATNTFLKRTVLVCRSRLDAPMPSDIAVDAEVLERLGGGSNLTIQVALCLAVSERREAGKPYLRGHWLSRKTFDIRLPKQSQDFDVEPTDEEGWKALGLPAKTLYYVEYYGGFDEPVSRDRPIARVRIHADVYRKLATESAQRLSRPMLMFLAAEISCQVLAASAPDWREATRPQPNSPLAAFLKRINRIQPCTLEQLRQMVEQPGMSMLRAVLHADQESVRRVVEV